MPRHQSRSLSTVYNSSHPRPVREAIDQYRRALDENPFHVVEQGMFDTETEHIPAKVKAAVADYLGGKQEEIALTGSTTMGLVPGTYDVQVMFTDRTYGTVDTFHHSVVVKGPGTCPL